MGISSNINPYALYVHCDAAMDYDSQNSGGVGIEIVFPSSIDSEPIKLSIGRYTQANIEQLELEAILQGLRKVSELFYSHDERLRNIKTIIITTDRFGLNDEERTNPFKIKEWRKNDWQNHDGKPIKNSDLLEKIDKIRSKLCREARARIQIDYIPSRQNRTADKLAKKGKIEVAVNDSIATVGIKIGKRKYDGDEIRYHLLKEKEEYLVHIFKKEPVSNQWEISAEFQEGEFLGKKLKIYTSGDVERKLHRHHIYHLRFKNVFQNHVTIFKTFGEDKKHIKPTLDKKAN